MIKVSPSLLAADYMNLGRDVKRIETCGADYVHIDIMDGEFVPNLSFGLAAVSSVRKVTELPLDVHLMIDRPLRYVHDFCKAGADILTIHVEADTTENNLEALRIIKSYGIRPAVSVKPGTPASALEPYWGMVDMILVMTVEPGFGGQSFMADMMPKVTEIRSVIDADYPEVELEVDGGVNVKTAKVCTDAGANVLVSGSSLFKAPDMQEFIDTLHQL